MAPRVFLTAFLLLPLMLGAQTPVPAAEAADPTECVSGVTLWLPPADPGETAVGPCPDCGGSGQVGYAKASRFRGELKGDTPVRVRCRRCGGSGRAPRRLTPDERIETLRRLRQAYAQRQLAAGRVPLGDAYADFGAADALDPRTYAGLAHRHPERCRTCCGLGVISCRACDGLGYEEEEAEAPAREEIRHTRIGSAIRRNDPDDGGTARTVRIPCGRCGGTGAVPCRKCDGSGLTPLCRRCDGVGFAQDRRRTEADGTPLIVRCKSCKGTGRR